MNPKLCSLPLRNVAGQRRLLRGFLESWGSLDACSSGQTDRTDKQKRHTDTDKHTGRKATGTQRRALIKKRSQTPDQPKAVMLTLEPWNPGTLNLDRWNLRTWNLGTVEPGTLEPWNVEISLCT